MRELTADQIKASDESDARGENFATVTPIQVHGPQANYDLAKAIHRANPRRYYALRDLYLQEAGIIPRPLSYWHTK